MKAPRALIDCAAAFQFLTRLPMPPLPWDEGSLARALAYFPVVGLAAGAVAAGINSLLRPHLGALLAAAGVLVASVLLTGAFHEDALADAADGFGGGWDDRERTLAIFRDSRIGAYGGVALVLSLMGRALLLAARPQGRFAGYAIAAAALCRWSSLPLSALLRPAHPASDGHAATIAGRVPAHVLLLGTAFVLAISAAALRAAALAPLLAAMVVTAVAGVYFQKRLGGVTGDCLGAANQVVELAVLCCGAWR